MVRHSLLKLRGRWGLTLTISILAVDDEESILALMELRLAAEGYRVAKAISAKSANRLIATEDFDIAVIDVGLPDGDGLDLVRKLRNCSRCGIIVVSGRGEITDRILGLEVGADDYIVKPFHFHDLIARIRALMRRLPARTPTSTLEDSVRRFGEYEINSLTRQVLRDGGTEVHLTTREFDVLWFLVINAPQVLTRDAIIEAAFGGKKILAGRPVDVIISRLRDKLFSNGSDRLRIRSVAGRGYQLIK